MIKLLDTPKIVQRITRLGPVDVKETPREIFQSFVKGEAAYDNSILITVDGSTSPGIF